MKTEMFLSSPKGISPETITLVLATFNVLANVTEIHSSVFNKKTTTYQVEKGVKIDIFNITPEKLIHLWIKGIKSENYFCCEDLDFHCAWINTPDYNGCILNSSWYVDFCVSNALVPEKCSEYE